jgi:hypothetical protein
MPAAALAASIFGLVSTSRAPITPAPTGVILLMLLSQRGSSVIGPRAVGVQDKDHGGDDRERRNRDHHRRREELAQYRSPASRHNHTSAAMHGRSAIPDMTLQISE